MKTEKEYYSIRQASRITGRSYRSVYNYIVSGKIKVLRIDNFKAIPASEIEKINNIEEHHKQANVLAGHKTVRQMSMALGIAHQVIKTYIYTGRLEFTQSTKGVYFIPDEIIDIWKKVKNPNPNKVEAYLMEAVTVQQAATKLGCSDSKIRAMVSDGELESAEGHSRWYVTLDSIRKHIGIDYIINDL